MSYTMSKGECNKLVQRDANWKPPIFIETQFESRVDYDAWVAGCYKKWNISEGSVSKGINVEPKGLDVVTKEPITDVNECDFMDVVDVSDMEFWAGVGSDGDVEGRLSTMVDRILGR